MPDFVNLSESERFKWLEQHCIQVDLVKKVPSVFICVDFIDGAGVYRQIKVGVRFGCDILLKLCEHVWVYQTQGEYLI